MKIKKIFKIIIAVTIIVFGIYTIIDVIRYANNPAYSAPWIVQLLADGLYLVVILLFEVLIYKIITQKTHYLAYGSNISIDLIKEHCKSVTYVGVGKLKNYKLNFKTTDNVRSFATIDKEKGKEVPIILYKISKKGLLNLDHYEEVDHGLYYKKRVIIFLNKRIYLPVIYIMNKTSKEMLPDSTYLAKIYKGYKEYNLDTNYIDEAINKIK